MSVMIDRQSAIWLVSGGDGRAFPSIVAGEYLANRKYNDAVRDAFLAPYACPKALLYRGTALFAENVPRNHRGYGHCRSKVVRLMVVSVI
jgi:hypothetical protein